MNHDSQNIAVRFCPPVPTWGSPLTFAQQFLPKLLDRLQGATLFTSLTGVDGASRVVSAINPFHRCGKLRRVISIFRYQASFAKELKKGGFDVLFCPFHNEALARSIDIRQVFIVHDLVPLLYPKDFIFSRVLWSSLYKRAILDAYHIICVSSATRSALLRHFPVAPERVSVVHNGFTPTAVFHVRNPQKRLLYVASAHNAHKNIPSLLTAFAHSSLSRSHELVIVGVPNPKHTPALKRQASLSGLASRIHFRSFLTQIEMEEEYAAAQLLVYPSLCEGFGLPLVESMARGLPICASNASAIPEICGDAALYFDPSQPADIARAMERLVADQGLQRKLEGIGRENVKRFSWRTSAETIASICADAA